ncbi:MAG TPA: hypothetical protein PLP61_16360, partial [Nocardioides sp.]|nr:hypothetical protein [Nocardioides sp.]
MNLDRLAAAKLWLVSEQTADLPYLAHALYALVPVACGDVPTMTVDEQWRLYVNPDWLATAPVPVVGHELAHLAWHLLAEHADRARDLHVDATTAGHWHTAADATVARTLDDAGLPYESLRDAAELGLPPDLSTEEYYAMLSGLPVESPESGAGGLPPTEGCGSGSDGVRRAHELPPDVDLGGVDREAATQIRRRVAIEYREHVTTRGLVPGEAGRWATRILEPRIAWEPLLAGAVRRAVGWTNGRADYTYARPSRRASSLPRVVLPGVRRPLPRVAVVV